MKTYIGEVKYYLRGQVHTTTPSIFGGDFGNKVVQWFNTLSIVADCNSDFPRIADIDSSIRYAKECIEDLEEEGEDTSSMRETLAMLEKAKAENRTYQVYIDELSQDDWWKDEFWFQAEDDEDACKKALLELGYGEGVVLYIKDDEGSLIYKANETYKENFSINWDTKRILSHNWEKDFVEYLLANKLLTESKENDRVDLFISSNIKYDDFVEEVKKAIVHFNESQKLVYDY